MQERLLAFSLRALLLSVAYISMLLAAFFYPGNVASILWRCTLFGTLTLAVLASIYRTKQHRAFWFGVATFGWTFFAMDQLPLPVSRPGLSDGIEELLHTYSASFHERQAATIAQAKVQADVQALVTAANIGLYVNSPQGKNLVARGTTQELQQIQKEVSRSLYFALLLAIAVLGGLASKALYGSRSVETRETNTTL
jgi:hypothetical protein